MKESYQMILSRNESVDFERDHYVKSVQIRNYFWSVFGHFSRRGSSTNYAFNIKQI